MNIPMLLLKEVGIVIIEGNLVDSSTGYSIIFNGRRLVLKDELEFDELEFNPLDDMYQANFILQYYIHKIYSALNRNIQYEGFVTDHITKKVRIIIRENNLFEFKTGYFHNICFAFIDAVLKINNSTIDITEYDKRW